MPDCPHAMLQVPIGVLKSAKARPICGDMDQFWPGFARAALDERPAGSFIPRQQQRYPHE